MCALPGKDVTLICALPDSVIIWSSPDIGQQEIHSSLSGADLGSDVHLQLDKFVYDLNTSYVCTTARAVILDIKKDLNGLQLTCSTTSYPLCRSVFSSTFMMIVIGKQIK